jgi:hypothetical protein
MFSPLLCVASLSTSCLNDREEEKDGIQRENGKVIEDEKKQEFLDRV